MTYQGALTLRQLQNVWWDVAVQQGWEVPEMMDEPCTPQQDSHNLQAHNSACKSEASGLS